MKLSDIMSAADLAIYAEVGLVLFLVAFVGVVVRVFWPSLDENYDDALMIPFTERPALLREQEPPVIHPTHASQKGAAGK